MNMHFSPESLAADSTRWSESSQRSVSAEWTTQYISYRYTCLRCGSISVFTATDQRYNYEIKKANINQKRNLCELCWKRSNAIASELNAYEHLWITSKSTLSIDKSFLERWAQLLSEREAHHRYKVNVARKDMIAKLLRDI